MDVVKFPVVRPERSVAEALAIMKEEEISGVVVPLGKHVSLVSYGELIARRIHKNVRLGNLEAVRMAPIIPPLYARRLNLPVNAILRTTAPHGMSPAQRQRMERFLQESGYSFAVMGALQRTYATVVTLSELGGVIYNAAPQDCYCSNVIRPHPYGPNHPDVCTYDGTQIKCH